MFKNIIWDVAGKLGVQIVSFGISIFLTRLLSPQEFGIMGMALVIVTFAHIFLDLGFNRAIIQQPEVSDSQYSTIFYLNVIIALLLTAICYFLAQPLSVFYKQPLIKPVFEVLSLSFLLNGLNLVPSSILYKKLKFKVNTIQTLTASIISGVVGVYMAITGYGVWSLVAQSLLASFLLLLFNWFYVRWVPRLIFDLGAIKPMWKYGSRLFASGLLDVFYTRLDIFLIGKIFSPAMLGFYTRAQSMDNVIRQFSVNSIMGALFPYIAKYQHDRDQLKKLYDEYLHVVLFTSIGMSGVFFLTAKSLFIVLFTSRWIYAAELFQLMTITGFAWPVSSLMCNVIAGVGNSAAFFRLEIYKKIMVLPVYFFGFFLGLKGFVSCMVMLGFAAVALNGAFAGKEINMKLKEQMGIVMKYFFVGVLSCLLSLAVFLLLPSTNEVGNVLLLTFVFTVFYLIGIYTAKLKGIDIIGLVFQKLRLGFQSTLQ